MSPVASSSTLVRYLQSLDHVGGGGCQRLQLLVGAGGFDELVYISTLSNW